MRRHFRLTLAVAAGALWVPSAVLSQDGATVSGRVTTEAGAPLASASVFIDGLNIGALTREDGVYSFVVPAARVQGQAATLTARLLGYKASTVPITLAAGTITQDFRLAPNPLRLGEVVVTGAGTVTQAEKLGNVRNNVEAAEIVKSNEANVVQALAAKAPNVEVTQSSGEPGSSSYIRIRGQRTITGGAQPLFVVDGVPIDNSSFSTSNFNPIDELGTGEISGTTQTNRAVDLNPSDIESVEILKGPAAGAIYGARAGQGVVLITTKKGRAGQTRYSWRSSFSLDDVSKTYPLQRRYGQGLGGVSALPCNDINKGSCFRSWGPDLQASGGTTYDHSDEAYDTGVTWDNTMTVSGGTDRTTFYLSLGRLNQEGVFIGPNNEFDRTTVRLNASHRLTDRLTVSGNVAYSDTRGEFIGRGNNVNGLQLGLLRTPPDFNNFPYLDPATGLHRSFRLQNPSPLSGSDSRGFDNPIFVLHEPLNAAKVGRTFGNVNAEWLPSTWLKVSYTLGADYSNDERIEGAPQASSDVSAGGRITEGTITNFELDHNLAGTATWTLSPSIGGTLTLGQNLSISNNRQLSVVGRTLVAPRPYKLSNTVNRDLPIDIENNIHRESYFGQLTVDLFDQLYLTAAVRNDGSSTFGEEDQRNWFPKGSLAWTFSNYLGEQPWVTFGKLRVAYGEAGTEPQPYFTSDIFNSGSILLTPISQGTGLSPSQGGRGGLYSWIVKAADRLLPERTKEFETGFDLGLYRDKADISFTFYNAITSDVILLTPLASSTGYFTQPQNSAEFRNRGYEVALNIRPLTTQNFAWDIGLQWARNQSLVTQLDAATFIPIDGVNTLTPYEVAKEGSPVGVFYDFGWVRCGVSPNGMSAAVNGVDLATVCAGQPTGALYIAASGFPVADPNQRVLGDPNPDWTGSVRSGFRYKKWEFSGLLDIRQGGDIYNGTRGALYSYGTHKDTEQRATCTGGVCTGNEKVFGRNGWFDGPVVGPGAGTAVPIGENWYRQGLGAGPFAGNSDGFIEDGSYVKLRELSVGYTLDNAWIRSTLGLTSLDLRVAGRNLKTWTDYTGYDPETNLGGAIQNTRGYDYFNMPQTRSYVFTVNLNR
ncbi:MAG TPA: SusC/RagA family TonB-linked outer membrane protein [Gemmatimonadaceae bacterium]|nr:SusC/RagA family TonB-linked outer membrane protein [Gemmatimonadaceae bacterium]